MSRNAVAYYAFVLGLLIVLALSGRWSWIRFLYAVPLAFAGLLFLIAGRAVPARFGLPLRADAAYRVLGLGLVAFAGVIVFGLTSPPQPWTVGGTVISSLLATACAVAMIRRPELSVFGDRSGMAGPSKT
jgi:hypothetical protein